MRRHFLMFAACIPLSAFAQGGAVPQSVMNELSTDLSALQQKLLQAQAKQQSGLGAVLWSLNSLGPRKVKITTNEASIRAGASGNAMAVSNALQGETFNVVDRVGDWYAVQLDKPVSGFGAGWVRASESVPVVSQSGSPTLNTQPNDIFDDILEGVNKMKQKYKDNVYISITGFSVNVALPPSVSVNVEFKK